MLLCFFNNYGSFINYLIILFDSLIGTISISL
jgi:hypothetical protein